MSNESYFGKFPQVTYANTATKDISRRVVVLNHPRMTPANYHPWEIIENMRPDHVAEQYYSDAQMDWLIFLTNKIIDPYYGWYMSSEDFDAYIIKKYGSFEYAQQKVLVWRNNWPQASEGTFSISYYENNLAPSLKKYFQPVWGTKAIQYYKRRQVDWLQNTNKIISVQANNSFTTADDILHVYDSGEQVGTLDLISANSSVIICNNVRDDIDVGDELRSRSNTDHTATITVLKTLHENISHEETVFWDPVFYYDAEYELNESRKFIDLLDPAYALETSEKIRKQLNT